MRRLAFGLFLIALFILVTLSGCSSGSSSSTIQQSGMVSITGQDAPIPSVLSFVVTINSITLGTGLSNGTVTGAVTVLSTPTTVDFARWVGLRTLLGLQSVTPGTYTVAQIVIANPTISVLNLGPPPSVSTQALLFSAGGPTFTLNVALDPSMTVAANGLGGLTMHFDLRNSLVTDPSGNITSVNPVITFRALQVPSDPDWEIDELRGTVISVGASSFILQRPDGRQFTIDVTNQTDFEGVASSLNSLPTGAVVEIAGQPQQDGNILASEVESYTTDHEFVEGIVLDTNPSSGAATSLTLLVRDQIPVVQGISIGNTANVAISSTTVFDIYHLNLPITQLLFNSSQMVAGQAVAVGGTVDNSTVPSPTLDADRIVLHRQGIDGMAVSGSINLNTGTFELQNNGFWGYVLQAPVNVLTTQFTQFINVSGLSAVTSSMQLRVVGLLLRDSNGNPILVAGRVINVQN